MNGVIIVGNKVKDLTGQKFGRLTVLRFEGVENRRAMFMCKCECGNKKVVQGQLLTNGHTKSCGCLASDNLNQTKHGLHNTRLYGVWCAMKSRCCNTSAKQYKNYGGRGITICREWQNDFQAFYDWSMASGYKESLTIDRIDVNGNYEPSNCRWVTQKEQCNNKRNNCVVTYNGKTSTLHELAEQYGVNYKTLWARINVSHWSIEKALNE